MIRLPIPRISFHRSARRQDGSPESTAVPPGKVGGLGTFEGVFTPSILTILGVIMYLRFGWVVGNVGVAGTLVIVTLSTAITFLTGLSVASIATDQRIRTGGAYYMISRSLGIETGGAVGIPLYLAQGLSVALYTVGFAESLVDVWPHLDARWVGVLTTMGVAALALFSARVAIRSQYFVMAAIVVSLVSLFLGKPVEPVTAELVEAPVRISEGFWVVFAVFFPAVTGIMAGINMSGDLENPARAIPRGTLAAIGTGYLIYMTIPGLLASRAEASTLIEDPLIMRRISYWGDAILLGVWGATLSSAIGSMLGAPRVLQALARDRVLPGSLHWLGRGSGPDDAPRAGTAVTLALALVAVWFGNLNLIAPILTMFFLTTYGVLNVAAGLERFLGSPSFRPQFRVHWSLSLLGAIGCVSVMLLIDPTATALATLLILGIYVLLERRELQAAWGDVRNGIWMTVARAGLLRLREVAPDPKTWRPHILVLSGAPTRRWHLIELAAAFTHNRALMTVAAVLPGQTLTDERRKTIVTSIHEYLARRGVQALVRVVPSPSHFVGAERLVEAYGLGSFRPNTVLMGSIEDPAQVDRYGEMIQHFRRARRNVVIVRDEADQGYGDYRRIDCWWGGLKGNGGLMLILAYLLQTSLYWRDAQVRIKMVVPDEDAARLVRVNLARILQRIRIGAIPDVLVADGLPFREMLHTHSRDADLILLGMREPGDDFVEYYEDLMKWTSGLGPTAFVLAAEDISFGRVLE